ncbi:MAG: hypothetical protein ACREFK_01110 [Stellaceae bacterium]
MRARLVLMSCERAIFTERAATEGIHPSLACPPGSVLLGWAAAQGPYQAFLDPFAVFHSGRVRFSNAVPLLGDGTPTYPMPHILVEPKHARGGIAGDRLAPDKLRIWHPDDGVQYDAVDNKGRRFVAADGRVVEPQFGDRLRTATRSGRAAPGQLFGYTHLEPGHRFAATIEADPGAIGDEDWGLLLGAFRGRTLFLGRGAGAYYGGAYECEVEEGGAELWPRGSVPAGAAFVRVWALSDLALLDARGAPCFAPNAAMLGLPAGGELDPHQSPLAARRYAPWNAHLGRRDVERQVIAAGSVLTFAYGAGAPSGDGPAVVGLWREAGLGRIWVAPPLLQAARGDRPSLPQAGAPRDDAPRDDAAPVPRPADPLINWAEAAREAAAIKNRIEAEAATKRERRA